MATFWQWNKSRTVRPRTWVCGPEPVLARLVVDAHREGAPPGQCVTLFAGDGPESEVWDQLLSVPPPGGRRAVVYGADKLKKPGNMEALDGLDLAVTVFVSSAADFAQEEGGLAPYLAELQASRSGQLVRCCAPSKPDDRITLVASWWPGASLMFARDVLNRCGSLQGAWHACEQARLAGLAPSPVAAAAVCHGEPGGEVADLLMAGNRSRAVAAAAQMSRGELGMAIGLLASRLAAIEQISELTRSGMQPREAAQRQHVDRYVAGKVIPYLPAYRAERVSRCRLLLAGADAAWRTGVDAGVAESLVALW